MVAAAAAALRVALVALACFALAARAQLPNLRMALPPDVDPNKKMDTQTGYELKPHDVPFGERFKASFKYYDAPWEPQLYRNKPAFKVACNYSANAYITSNMALHPYWFREFGLDRWCRQDVCASVWTEDHSHDLMFKVTDVCPPSVCKSPFEVRVEAWKASYLFYHREGRRPNKQAYLYFSPCWMDGLPQPDLKHTLPGPELLNSRHWMIRHMHAQHALNQAWNKKRGRPVRQLGSLVRPWATLYPGQLGGYRAENYGPGSDRRVVEQYKRKLEAEQYKRKLAAAGKK